MGKDSIDEMLKVNKEQKAYYEFDPNITFRHGGNPLSKLWDKLREFQYKVTDDLDLNNRMFDLQKEWLGELKGKKVMDLGCHTGNELSIYLARNSESYVGIDLSSSALSVLEKTFSENGIDNYRLYDEDILSPAFPEEEFDIIYAKAVFHHFKYFDDFLIRLKSLLKDGGIIITIDPLNTYPPLKLIRSIYRIFQKDKDWEYPFTVKSLESLQKHFKVISTSGMMGKAKKAILLYIFSKRTAIKLGEKWISEDMYNNDINHRDLRKCLRVSFLLRKDED